MYFLALDPSLIPHLSLSPIFSASAPVPSLSVWLASSIPLLLSVSRRVLLSLSESFLMTSELPFQTESPVCNGPGS